MLSGNDANRLFHGFPYPSPIPPPYRFPLMKLMFWYYSAQLALIKGEPWEYVGVYNRETHD